MVYSGSGGDSGHCVTYYDGFPLPTTMQNHRMLAQNMTELLHISSNHLKFITFKKKIWFK